MKQKQIVGIDVSKHSLDICIKPAGMTFQITNDGKGFKCLGRKLGVDTDTLVVMEHTGHYSLKLERFLKSKGIGYCKIPALQIKRSLGVIRGKDDQVDAVRIAEYGWLRKDQLVTREMLDENILELRSLLSLRSKLVRDRSGYICRQKEIKNAEGGSSSDVLSKCHNQMIKALSVQIKTVEAHIQTVIQSDQNFRQTQILLCSIKGVGRIIAAHMIALTENFKRFSDARKFNCYAGLAPFKHESGSSIKSRSRISHLANKEIKTLLNLAAFCAIRFDLELKQYYQRRVSEGKRKMSCLNIIRSKIVARMFAVVKRQSGYQELHLAA